MDPVLLIAFLTTTFLFVAVPGPSVAFATAQALKYGGRAACVTVAGDALGSVVHIIIAVSSLSLLVSVSQIVLPYFQIAGGVFILYMAYKSFTAPSVVGEAVVLPAQSVTFFAGFLACVTNPKAIVFFVALFPAFISPQHDLLLQSLVYGAIFVVLDGLAILAYAMFAMVSVRRVTKGWISVGQLSGIGLAGVGVAMVAKGYRSIP